MRVTLALMLTSGAVLTAQPSPPAFPDEAKAHHWRMLDSSQRARAYASWYTLTVTDAQFHKMQQQYRPHDFDVWAERLRQLRPGMTEKQVVQIVYPKEPDIQLAHMASFSDIILLNDAYFTEVFFDDQTRRMTWASPPLAITYEIKPFRTKLPKT